MYQIKDEADRQKTLEHIKGFKAQIERVRQKHGPERSRNFKTMAEQMIKQFEEQVKTYDQLKQRN
ncbi:MAG: hypothetical protein HY737_04795 [Candidatus Omnitrophica bacterium]|nr:hypothetical protein [Candidatus Omnitrophota bacterium]